jgi:hypothetical protein
MKTFTLDTQEAGNFAYAAAKDAERINNKWRSSYTQAQRDRILRAQDLLDCAYSFHQIYINFRKKFATIKIEGARIKDGILRGQLEAWFEESGSVEKCETPQGVIYRFIKA